MVRKMAMRLALFCLKWQWGSILLPEAALRQGLWYLKWQWGRVCGA